MAWERRFTHQWMVSPTWSALGCSEGKTRPGQSQRRTLSVRKMVWKCLVWPGVRDTLTTLRPIRALSSDDLPTLGCPVGNHVGQAIREVDRVP